MNVVDSSGWLEYSADGPNAEHFATPILDTEHLLVAAISILEVFKRICQQRDENAALAAAPLGIDHKLPLADSVILASTRRYDATHWTQDTDFQGLEDVRYFAKP